LYYNTLFIINL